MSDQKQAVTESSPDSQEAQVQPEASQEVSTTDVTAQKAETSVDQETSSPKEQEAQVENKKDEQSSPPEEKPQEQEDVQLSKKAQKRFQELIEKLKEKDRLLQQQQQKKEEKKEDVPIEYDDDGNPIVDPQKLLEIAEQRAYQKALQAVQQERQIEEYRQKAQEFLEDTNAVADKLKSNKALEKLATRIFEAENYVIDPVSGKEVFVPRKKMSEIVKELESDLEGLSVKAQAEVQAKLQEVAEGSALRPSEHQQQEEQLTQEQINELLIKNPQKLARMLEKKLGFAE